MRTHRFGKRLKLPATRAIKHQVRLLMLDDLIKAEAETPASTSPDGTAPQSSGVADGTRASAVMPV